MQTHGLDTIWPEVGKRYRLRNGTITGVMQEYSGLALEGDPDRFYTEEQIDDYRPMWRSNGRSTFFNSAGDGHGGFSEEGWEIHTPGQSVYDTIAEYTE